MKSFIHSIKDAFTADDQQENLHEYNKEENTVIGDIFNFLFHLWLAITFLGFALSILFIVVVGLISFIGQLLFEATSSINGFFLTFNLLSLIVIGLFTGFLILRRKIKGREEISRHLMQAFSMGIVGVVLISIVWLITLFVKLLFTYWIYTIGITIVVGLAVVFFKKINISISLK